MLKQILLLIESVDYIKFFKAVKAMNMAHYCPEQVFWKMCVKKDEEAYVSTKKVKEAFERFCADREVKGKYNIGDYIKNIEKIPTERKRIDDEGNLVSIGNPVAVYKGLRIRKKYL